jgi:hypothetical protein
MMALGRKDRYGIVDESSATSPARLAKGDEVYDDERNTDRNNDDGGGGNDNQEVNDDQIV